MQLRRILWVALPIATALVASSIGCGSTRDGATDSDAGAAGGNGPSCVIDTECSGDVCAQIGAGSSCAKRCASDHDCAGNAKCRAATTVAGDSVTVCVADDGAPPSVTDAGSVMPVTFDAGPPVKASVGADGGTTDRLVFAAVGDTRPPFIDDTKGYPTATIDAIYTKIAALAPAFVVSTGDYIFANPFGSQAAAQFPLYLAARAKYSGVLFPALGNHECLGNEGSNCGAGTLAGTPNNYSEFVKSLLTPIGKTEPYYSVRVDATDGSWTSKLVFVAANAWTQAQADWLDQTLAVPTTYTFVMRHEPKAATKAPGTSPSEAIMAKHPYTLAIVGHTHTHERTHPKEVIFGNGGAPLTAGQTMYGFGMLTQRHDGAIQVDVIDVATGQADAAFRFAVKADGTAAP